jgi:hypothetical protein
MNVFGIDIAHIVELGTQVATTSAIRATEMVADDVFDYLVGVAILIYEMDPNG